MARTFTTLLAASAFALTSLAPVSASAQRWGHDDYYGTDAYGCRDDNNYGCERDRDRRLARRGGYGDDRYGYGDDYYDRCYDRYGRDHCYDRRRDNDDDDDALAAGVVGLVLGAVIGSAITSSNNQRSNEGYQNCTRQERRWDRQRQRYVYVDVPC